MIHVTPSRVRAVTLALSLAALALGVRLCWIAVSAIHLPTHTFVSYYTASRLLIEGAPVERFYENDWFRAEVHRFEPTVSEIFNANPPTAALLALPVAWLEYRPARVIGIFANLVLVLGVALWLARRLRLEGAWAAAFFAFVLGSAPVRANVDHAQVYVPMLALLTAAWWAYRSERPETLGGALGAAVITKAFGFAFWPMLIVERRVRALAWGAAAALGVVIMSLPWIGVAAWREFLRAGAELARNPLLAVTAYQSFVGFFRHLLGPGGDPIGAPLVVLPAVAGTAAMVAALGLLAVSLRAAWRAPGTNAVFAAFVLLALVTSPVTGEAHFAVALLPVALLAADIRESGRSSSEPLVLFLGALLVTAPLQYRSPALNDGALALLAYPRLYGALLLWGLAIALSRRAEVAA